MKQTTCFLLLMKTAAIILLISITIRSTLILSIKHFNKVNVQMFNILKDISNSFDNCSASLLYLKPGLTWIKEHILNWRAMNLCELAK